MLKRNDEAKGIEIEISLTPEEALILSATVKTQAFDILQKLMEDQVRKFNLKLINTPGTDQKAILANFAVAKAVTQFYAGLMSRLEEELNITYFNNRTPNPGNPENNMAVPEWAGSPASHPAEAPLA